jgi:hypothetical protein
MLSNLRNRLTFAAMLVSLAGFAGTASAETTKPEQKVLNGQENGISSQIPPK